MKEYAAKHKKPASASDKEDEKKEVAHQTPPHPHMRWPVTVPCLQSAACRFTTRNSTVLPPLSGAGSSAKSSGRSSRRQAVCIGFLWALPDAKHLVVIIPDFKRAPLEAPGGCEGCGAASARDGRRRLG